MHETTKVRVQTDLKLFIPLKLPHKKLKMQGQVTAPVKLLLWASLALALLPIGLYFSLS